MRCLLLALAMALPTGALADVSTDIRDTGLAGARTSLEALPSPSADEQFALAGVLFLEALEAAFRSRWDYGLTSGNLPMPLFQSTIPPNPSPEPFRAETFRDITAAFLSDMAAVEAALAAIPPGAPVSVELSLPDLWFDVNGDGTRADGEALTDIVLPFLLGRGGIDRLERGLAGDPAAPDPREATIRFDRSDVHWLAAYAQVLQGATELVLAFDPTAEIEKVLAVQAAIAAQTGGTGGFTPEERAAIAESLRLRDPDITDAEIDAAIARFARSRTGGMGRGFGEFGALADLLSVVIETLRHDPDPARIAKARDHFLATIAENRLFWAALAQETDNDNEWIPNPNQTAALGLELPGEIGPAWLAVLDDAEAMLTGEVLIPFWRFAPGYGIDLAAYVENPAPVPVVEWIQGSAALPYAAEGTVVSMQSWRLFTSLVRGQTGLMVILLN